MPLIDVGQQQIFYKDYRNPESDRLPTLLVHGAGGNYQNWPSALRRAPDLNAIALDLPGHGSSPPPAANTILDYAALVFALLDALKIEQVIVAGHSMGGAIAQWMALHAPQRVRGLILAATAAHLSVSSYILEHIISDTEATARKVISYMWPLETPQNIIEQSVEALLTVAPQVLHGDFLACDGFDVRPRSAELTLPALVLAAENDKMIPFADTRALADALPDATFINMGMTGHMFPLFAPDECMQHVIAWRTKLDF